MSMFCYQCEQAAQGTGCTVQGVCGKSPEISNLQDELVYKAKAISMYAHRARRYGRKDHEIDAFIPDLLFVTVTNTNFDPGAHHDAVYRAGQLLNKAQKMYEDAARAAGQTPEDLSEKITDLQQPYTGIRPRREFLGDDVTGLQELMTYGLKGMAAYTHHARLLGVEDDGIYGYFHEAMAFLASEDSKDIGKLLPACLKVGEMNLQAMAMLDRANTGAYGNPEPTQVRITPVKGKCILVSGHDLRDLELILQQTQGKGVNVYTHCEMLPANAYPGLKKYPHLAGNYGGAWQVQQSEFAAFPGPIVMTTNCVIKPTDVYKDRLFTRAVVGWPGVRHLDGTDFSEVVECALASPGFTADEPEKRIPIGFAHEAVMGVAGTVIDAVKAGKIRHFFLIGGCDGARPGRNYYTDFAQQVPEDCVILTVACGKFRFNKLPFGDIGGIPRLLDCGQCNDSYSAIQIALALAKAFECGVNELPLSLILSWFEQKAVAILLTLLHLGVRNIRLGPTLPAFVTPAVLNVLVEKFNVAPIRTPQEDLQAILA